MPLQCNIDSKGKALRLTYGLILIVLGVLSAIFWAYPNGGLFPWIISAAIFAGGAFAIFEARAGWCAIRAMGFRTPL
jgi:hypothetical protein